jgi:hypothetical protein
MRFTMCGVAQIKSAGNVVSTGNGSGSALSDMAGAVVERERAVGDGLPYMGQLDTSHMLGGSVDCSASCNGLIN